MPPRTQKEFQAFVDAIPDSKIEWQNYSRGASHTNVFGNNVKKEPFRMDMQKFVKGHRLYDENNIYFDLAVQSNREGAKFTSEAIAGDLKDGMLGPVYATLKMHPDARPDAATFKELLLLAGKDCHYTQGGEPLSYCIQVEADCSWHCHQLRELSGQGTPFVPPNQKKVDPAPAPAPAAPAQDDDKNTKGKKKGKKGGK